MIQPIGLVFLTLGLFSLYRRPEFAVGLMLIATAFGTASMVNAGGSSILVVYAAVIILTFRIALWAGVMALLRPLMRTGAGVTLLMLFVFAVLSGYFMPRLFSGVTNTVSITEASNGLKVIQFLPLVPSGTNITQTIYLTLGVTAFCSMVAFLRRTQNFDFVIKVFCIVAAVQILASLLDLLTFYSSSAALLGPVRNANYAYLCALEKGGLKRMCGFMSEASAYASYTLVIFAVLINLWIDRVRPAITGPLAAGLFVGLVISTSGSGYVGLAMLLGLLVTGRCLHFFGSLPFRRFAELALALFFAGCIVIFALALLPSLGETLSAFLEETVFGKLDSASGRERTLWNQTAIQNFFDTNMMGAGLGSTRGSSIAVVLLSQVGIPGTILFVLHISLLMLSRLEPALTHNARALVTAVRWAIVAHLIVAILAKGDFVFPMLFYALCGIVVAGLRPFGARAQARSAAADRRRNQAAQAI
ncbi:hypothetical protein [Oceanibium sediminis]|uniref:hypothetical protein n=1 Tax=Oceanibium sediminis TaxID=2026339 RepID=UPI000DD2FCB7|nr:hypothetical protein [Oceanibium sediminis]